MTDAATTGVPSVLAEQVYPHPVLAPPLELSPPQASALCPGMDHDPSAGSDPNAEEQDDPDWDPDSS